MGRHFYRRTKVMRVRQSLFTRFRKQHAEQVSNRLIPKSELQTARTVRGGAEEPMSKEKMEEKEEMYSLTCTSAPL
jgi:hypothetical protein